MTNHSLSSIVFLNENTGWTVGGNNILKSTNSGNDWVLQSCQTLNSLQSVFFTTENNGAVVGDSGKIFKTVNGGLAWTEISSGVNTRLNSVHFADQLNGWSVGDSAVILKTSDGGKSWTQQTLSIVPRRSLQSVFFISPMIGYLAGNRTIAKTTNGGLNWSIQGVTNFSSFNDLFFVNKDTGWICGRNGEIYRTQNGGLNWTIYELGDYDFLYSIEFENNNNGWCSSEDGIIFKTSNGGDSWDPVTIGSANTYLYSLTVMSGIIWVAGQNGVVYRSDNGGFDWALLTQQLTENDLTAVTFINENTGWVAGRELYKTTNGGDNWIYKRNFESDVVGLNFFDSAAFLATARFVMKSTDGGESWVQKTGSPTSYNYQSISFATPDFGIVVGYGGMIHVTTDAGETWIHTSPTTYHLTGVYCSSPADAYVTGVNVFLHSTNRGMNWSLINGYSGEKINFSDANTGWVIAANSILNTTDAGNSWYFQNAVIPNGLFRCIFSLSGQVANISGGRVFLHTTDGGINWQSQRDVPFSFTAMYYTSDDKGWGVGYAGMIAKYHRIPTAVSSTGISIPESHSLSQNYPNPFNPQTTINYRINDAGYVSLKIYSVDGKEISALINENKSKGSYDLSFDGSSLSSGVYFYSLMLNGNVIDTKRMVLLK